VSGSAVTLGAPPARRADLESFLTEEGVDWPIVEGAAGILNVVESAEAGAACTKQTLHPGGRIDCSTALAMADELEVDSRVIGRLMNLLGIRIRNCQLGCFP
jgi:hypothetical protein